MFTVRTLFMRRVLAYWKYQINVLRVVADWVVALYFIVPGMAFVIYQYHHLWLGAPTWMAKVPFLAVIIILRLTAIGTVRLFVEEADQLFMLQRVRWFRDLMKFGLIYTIVVHFLLTIFVIVLILPILRLEYTLTTEQLFGLGLFMCSFRLCAAMAIHLLSVRLSGWRYGISIVFVQLLISGFFVLVLFDLLEQPMIVMGISMLLFSLFGFMMRYRLKLKGTFFHDAEHERTQKLKMVSILLIGRVRGRPHLRRRQPLLFRNSKLLFKLRTPANGLAEMCIKTFFRDSTRVAVYSVIVLSGMALIGTNMFPNGLKKVIWVILAIVITIWLKRYWREMMASSFVRMFKWKDETKSAAARQALFYMLLPGFLLISAAFGLGSFSLIEGLIMIPTGGLIAFTVSRLLVPW